MVNTWNADFYVKMDDNVGLSIGEKIISICIAAFSQSLHVYWKLLLIQSSYIIKSLWGLVKKWNEVYLPTIWWFDDRLCQMITTMCILLKLQFLVLYSYDSHNLNGLIWLWCCIHVTSSRHGGKHAIQSPRQAQSLCGLHEIRDGCKWSVSFVEFSIWSFMGANRWLYCLLI